MKTVHVKIEKGKINLIYPEPDMAGKKIKIKGMKSFYKKSDVIKALELGYDVLWKYPERGLHRRSQLELGDVLIDLLEKYPKRKIIAETFSEEIYLRLQNRFLNTYEIEASDVVLFCIGYNVGLYSKIISIKKICIDKNGKFSDSWPNYFFGHRIEEL